MNSLLDLIFKRPPVGNCVICGQKTDNTKAGQFVCGYDDENSLNCSEVWNEKNVRDIRSNPDDDEYDWYRQEEYNDYKSYISSYDWQVKADSLKRDVGYRCEKCGAKNSKSKLHVHHKHYKTLYKERRKDVTVLCERCHAAAHGKL